MSQWQEIASAPTDYTEVIGMDRAGRIYRTWFFAPSSQTRNWLRVPGNKPWNPVYWMPLPSTGADEPPTETQEDSQGERAA